MMLGRWREWAVSSRPWAGAVMLALCLCLVTVGLAGCGDDERDRSDSVDTSTYTDPENFLPSTNPLLGAFVHIQDSDGADVADGGHIMLSMYPDGRCSFTGSHMGLDIRISSPGTYEVVGHRITMNFEHLWNGATNKRFSLDGHDLTLPFRAITNQARGDDGTSSWRRLDGVEPENDEARDYAELETTVTDASYLYLTRMGRGGAHASAAAEVVAFFTSQPRFSNVRLNAAGSVISFDHASELPGELLLRGFFDNGVGLDPLLPRDGAEKMSQRRLSTEPLAARASMAPQLAQHSSRLYTPDADQPTALVLSPSDWELSCGSRIPGVCAFVRDIPTYPPPHVTKALEDSGYVVDVLLNTEAGVDGLWAALATDYDVIYFIGHGRAEGRLPSDDAAIYLGDVIGLPPPIGNIKFSEYKRRLGRYPGVKVKWVVGEYVGGSAVTGDFFTGAREAHGVDWANTLVYLSGCETDQNPTFRDAFGSRFFIGWGETVDTNVAFATSVLFFNTLAEARSTTLTEGFTDAFDDVYRASPLIALATDTTPCIPAKVPGCNDDAGDVVRCEEDEDCPPEYAGCVAAGSDPEGVDQPGTCRCPNATDCAPGLPAEPRRCDTDDDCSAASNCNTESGLCGCADAGDCGLLEQCVGGECRSCPYRACRDLKNWHVYSDCDEVLEPLDRALQVMMGVSAFDTRRPGTWEEAQARCSEFERCLREHWAEGFSGGLGAAFCHGFYPAGLDPTEAVETVNGLLCDDPAPACEQLALWDYEDR